MQAGKSGLGSALVGGIIGAAVGVGLHVVLETGMLGTRVEASWFAVVIGVLTGIGVRMACRGCMERSYARGAVAGLIALAAIVASSFAVQEVMSRREVQAKAGPIAAAKDDAAAGEADADDASAAKEPAEEPADDARADVPRPVGIGVGPPKGGASDLNPWQFVFMALGGLVAYELGRGADPSKRTEVVEGAPGEPAPRVTDPSV
jgi:hypothetical protein